MKENDRNASERVRMGDIAARAFEIWQQEGSPQGRYLQYWLQAVKQAEAEGHSTGLLTRKGDARNGRV